MRGWATAFRAPFAYISLQPSKPEGSSNVEAGLKLALPKAGLSGTLALVSQTHDNVATADPNNVGFYIQSGRQRACGVEVDLVWEPSPALSPLANYAYTDTRDNGVALGVSVVNLGGQRAWDPYSYMGYPVVGPNQPRSAYVTLKVRI